MNNRHIFGTILALVVYMFANGFAMPSRPCYQGPSDADSNNRINTRVSGDHSPPTITISVSAPTGENGWYNEPIFVRVNALDEGSGKVITQVSLGGYRWYDDALKIATDGEFMIVAKATDRSGNTSRVTKIVKLDMTPPEVFLKVPEPEGLDNYHIGIVPIVITGTDNLSGVVDSGVEANGSAHFIGKNATIATARVSITESGSYRVEGYVKDEAGNRTQISIDLMVDLDAPEVTITSPKEYNNDIHISGSAVDKESGIKRVLVDYGDGWSLMDIKDSQWNTIWPAGEIEDGKYPIRAKIVDNAGNESIVEYSATIVNTFWPFFALSALLIAVALYFVIDPRKKEWVRLTNQIQKHNRMYRNGLQLGLEEEYRDD